MRLFRSTVGDMLEGTGVLWNTGGPWQGRTRRVMGPQSETTRDKSEFELPAASEDPEAVSKLFGLTRPTRNVNV